MNKKCAVYRTVEFIGKKWTLLILLELYKGKLYTRRYSELKKSLPNITPKILSSRLKELEKREMLNKKITTETFPIKCEYSLTKRGLDFVYIIKNIKKWALKWNINNKICKTRDCQYCEF